MRLASPVYESLPYVYMALGALAMFLFYLDPVGVRQHVLVGVEVDAHRRSFAHPLGEERGVAAGAVFRHR